jgi:hypothetical protein
LSDWKLTARLNTFKGNAGGIWIIIGEVKANPRDFKFPSGSISYNSFIGNTKFGLAISETQSAEGGMVLTSSG